MLQNSDKDGSDKNLKMMSISATILIVLFINKIKLHNPIDYLDYSCKKGY